MEEGCKTSEKTPDADEGSKNPEPHRQVILLSKKNGRKRQNCDFKVMGEMMYVFSILTDLKQMCKKNNN